MAENPRTVSPPLTEAMSSTVGGSEWQDPLSDVKASSKEAMMKAAKATSTAQVIVHNDQLQLTSLLEHLTEDSHEKMLESMRRLGEHNSALMDVMKHLSEKDSDAMALLRNSYKRTSELMDLIKALSARYADFRDLIGNSIKQNSESMKIIAHGFEESLEFTRRATERLAQLTENIRAVETRKESLEKGITLLLGNSAFEQKRHMTSLNHPDTHREEDLEEMRQVVREPTQQPLPRAKREEIVPSPRCTHTLLQKAYFFLQSRSSLILTEKPRRHLLI
jgi:hypothetical protein